MNRRDFLKTVTAAAIVVAAPSVLVRKDPYSVLAALPDKQFSKKRIGDYSQFDEDAEYGNQLAVTDLSEETLKRTIPILEKDIIKCIPPSHRHKVEYRATIPQDYGRSRAVAWYYSPL